MIKMTLGQSTFNAFCYGLYLMTGIKVGYISIIYNIMIMGIEMITLHRHFHKSLLLQLVPGMISGLILNYFVYDLPLTAQLSISSYALSIIVFMSGLVLNAFGISLVINAGIIGFPTESLCQLLEQKTTHSFQFYRTLFDVGYVAVAMMIMLNDQSLTLLREGTIINLVAMGTMIGMINRWAARFYVRSLQS